MQLLMGNWADGMADNVISYESHSGLDAWRKLYHPQLPEIKIRRNY